MRLSITRCQLENCAGSRPARPLSCLPLLRVGHWGCRAPQTSPNQQLGRGVQRSRPRWNRPQREPSGQLEAVRANGTSQPRYDASDRRCDRSTWGSVMKATMRMACPQRGHSRGSTSKMRRNKSAQRRRASRRGTGTDAAYTVCCPSVPARRLMPRVRDAYQP